jgi:hypothetical protein
LYRIALVGITMLVLPAFSHAPEQSLAQPQVPKGIPGFLNPNDGRFTPLDQVAPPIADSRSSSGTFDIHINFDFLRQYATVFCTVQLQFGNLAGSPPQFFTNHFATASDNFSAAEPVEVIPVPYNYTPSGNGRPKMRIDVTCQAYDNAGVEHTASDTSAAMDIPSGNPSYDAFEDF